MMILKDIWTIKKYSSEDELIWDYFVDNEAINSTFLHSRRFLKHNELNLIEDFSFIFYKKGKFSACIPAILISSDGYRTWNSHMRSTYGGLILSKNIGIEDVLEITKLLEQELLKNKVDEAIIRNTFRIFNRMYCDEFDYSLWKSGYQLKSREIEIGISLEGKKHEDIVKSYENGNKYNIKKALKNVDVRLSNDYLIFWNILEKNLAQKHELKPVHDFITISNLISNLKENEIKLFSAYIDDQMISGMVLFDFHNTHLHAQYIASDFTFQHLRPVNAVIDYALKWACDNEYKYFNLGTPNEQNGHIINLGLSYFKEGFGGRSCLRETMHKIYKYENQ